MQLLQFPMLASTLASLALAATNTSTAPPYSPTNAPMFQLSSDSQFAFYLEEVLALCYSGAAASGEVLRIATGLIPSNFESTYDAFYPMAKAIRAQGDSAKAKQNTVSASEAYFRAATYYRGADFFLIGNVSDPRVNSLWDQQLDAFDEAIALARIAAEKFTLKAHSPNVPGGEFQVIGRFFKAPNSHGRTPTVVIGSGYDGSQEESYHDMGTEILKQGYNVVTYEGPGQPTVRRQQNIGFIPDWYNVATPVVDYLSQRPDVDMTKLALVGISFGGTLAPIAASKEPRFTQVLAIDGLVSIQQQALDEYPPAITNPFKNGSVAEFNQIMHAIQRNSSYPSQLRWFIDNGLFAFNTTDPYEWFSRMGNISMTPDVVKTMKQPVFVAKGQDDTLSLNQPNLAYNLFVSGRPNGQELTTFHEFNISTGAGEHTALGAEAQQAQAIVEWLDSKWHQA